MKQSDIFTIIIVATVGTVVAAILCNMILGDPNSKSVTFKNIAVVESSLTEPDPEVFNIEAINPTVEVYVGNCVDQDQDGKLSDEELAVCGRGVKSNDGGENSENSGQDNNQETTIIIQEGE